VQVRHSLRVLGGDPDHPLKQVQALATKGRIDTHCDTTMEPSDEEWDRMLRIHLSGTFYCSREALKITTERQMAPARSTCPASVDGFSPTI